MRCKECNKRRKVNENGYCSVCQTKINWLALYALGKIFSDPILNKAFCDDITEAGEAMRRAMKALQGDTDAE